MPPKALLLLAATAVFLTGAYFFSLYALHGFSPDFWAINECFESGGRWNHKLRVCERMPGIYIPPDSPPAVE